MVDLFILMKRALDEKKHNCNKMHLIFQFFYSMTSESCRCRFSYHGEIINEHTRTFVAWLKKYRNAKWDQIIKYFRSINENREDHKHITHTCPTERFNSLAILTQSLKGILPFSLTFIIRCCNSSRCSVVMTLSELHERGWETFMEQSIIHHTLYSTM